MQFVPYDEKVEVIGAAVLSTLEGMGVFRSAAIDLLAKNGIKNPTKDGWYPQKAWLETMKEISGKMGPNTVFMVGTKILDNAVWPPDIDNLQKGLTSIDAAYHMNHRNGRVGNYKLVSFNDQEKTAKVVCDNPYPCDFDRGLITTVSRTFRPTECPRIDVIHDTSSPCRKTGADSCTYIIKW
jgi:hypothetical protein